MRRRDALGMIGGMAAWPWLAHAQGQRQDATSGKPIIGFLHSGSPEPNAGRVERFRKGLADAGFVDGRNATIEYCWASGQNGRLPDLAAELIAKGAAVITTLSSTPAAVAAHAATKSTPIFFLIAEPPVDLGLVASLSRPGGNATGIITMALELTAKRLDLLRELNPQAAIIAMLHRPHPGTKLASELLRARADALGIPIQLQLVSSDDEIDAVYAGLEPNAALVVGTSPYFFVRRDRLATLAARRRIPSIHDNREYAQAGCLMSYGANTELLWEQAGAAVARILKGEPPANMPVAQAAAFELVINAKTAGGLGLTVPPSLLARAEEVIE